jgi:hypothetical protein
VTNDLGRCRSLAAQQPAELTDNAIGAGGRASIQMNVLTGQRSTPTISAAMPIGLESADAATQQDALELLDMTGGGGHRLKDSSSHV